jgi:zinc transport system ATP-binding protein
MTKEILQLQNIFLSYDNKKTYVLKDISFSVFSGEVLSIIWLNWSWKSSLLKIISGIKKQNSWEIIRNYNKLSYVPQKINLEDSFPLQVKEFIKIYNEAVKISDIEDFLGKFNSKDLLNKRVDKLSWWQLQKVLIISALLSNPDLILLDEPTAWIDMVWEEIFYEIIKEVKSLFPKISIILVSHNINLVYKNSDKVICLHDNNFCCHWTPGELWSNPTIKNIFWEYTLPYNHKPHSQKEHKSCEC